MTGAGKIGTQVVEQIGSSLRSQFGPRFDEFWKEFASSVKGGDLENMIVPIYAKHFETSEIEEIIRFNQTPVGRKFIREMPAIVQESTAAGIEWGQSLAKSAIEKFRERKDR
jgi:hypothetical protein